MIGTRDIAKTNDYTLVKSDTLGKYKIIHNRSTRETDWIELTQDEVRHLVITTTDRFNKFCKEIIDDFNT